MTVYKGGFYCGFDTKLYQSPRKNRAVTLSINHAYICNARHCERSEVIQDLRKNWIASSLRFSQ